MPDVSGGVPERGAGVAGAGVWAIGSTASFCQAITGYWGDAGAGVTVLSPFTTEDDEDDDFTGTRLVIMPSSGSTLTFCFFFGAAAEIRGTGAATGRFSYQTAPAIPIAIAAAMTAPCIHCQLRGSIVRFPLG